MRKFILVILSILCVGSFLLTANTAQRKKARYYFMQGSQELAMNNPAAAYEYMKKAYELDPSYDDAAFTYGNQRLFVDSDTLQSEAELLKSLRMMQQYVDNNPLDLYAAQMYGYVTAALDTLEETVRVYEKTYELMPGETQLLQLLADAYIRKLKWKDALGVLEKYEKIEGKSKDLTWKKLNIRLVDGDTIGAIEEINALVDFNPRDPYTYVMKGRLYELTNQLDSTYSAYIKAQELEPENGTVKMSLADYYQAVGDTVKLDQMVYEGLLSEDFAMEDKLAILIDYIQKLISKNGDTSRGDHLFTVLLEQYPHEPDVLEMAARYSSVKGDFKQAREYVDYAIDLSPDNETYWLMLMSYDMQEEKYRDAVKTYQKAKEHVEPTLPLRNLYAASISMLDDVKEQEKLFEELLVDSYPELDPKTVTEEIRKKVRDTVDVSDLLAISNLYTMMGDMHYKEKQVDKAFANYDIALYFMYDNALTLNNYAYFLSETDRDLEKAEKMSRLAIDISDANPTYYDTYAWVLYKLGNLEDAMKYMEKALELAKEYNDDNEEYQIHYEAIKKALDSKQKEEKDQKAKAGEDSSEKDVKE